MTVTLCYDLRENVINMSITRYSSNLYSHGQTKSWLITAHYTGPYIAEAMRCRKRKVWLTDSGISSHAWLTCMPPCDRRHIIVFDAERNYRAITFKLWLSILAGAHERNRRTDELDSAFYVSCMPPPQHLYAEAIIVRPNYFCTSEL